MAVLIITRIWISAGDDEHPGFCLTGGSHSAWVRRLLAEKLLVPNGEGNIQVC